MCIRDSNDSIRDMLAGIFKPFYEVLTAADGAEGLALVRSEMPNIVVSDVVMPNMSGTALCKQIKSDFNTCHIPVVLLTARTVSYTHLLIENTLCPLTKQFVPLYENKVFFYTETKCSLMLEQTVQCCELTD